MTAAAEGKQQVTQTNTTGKFAQTPKHGAALRWIVEHLYVQVNECSSREKLAAIEKFVNEVLVWAVTQDTETRAAFMWAGEKVLGDARARFEMHENHRIVATAYDSMPKPPDMK